jgi:hypothetical protein
MKSFNERKRRRTSWSAEDVRALKTDFLSGKRVKEIARNLGRTQTAVAKFLSREGLKRRMVKPLNCCTFRSQNYSEDRDLGIGRFGPYKCSDFNDVLSYLEAKGYFAYRTDFVPQNFRITCPIDDIFIMNSRPTTKMRLVLLANKLRLEERKTIFEIDEIN